MMKKTTLFLSAALLACSLLICHAQEATAPQADAAPACTQPPCPTADCPAPSPCAKPPCAACCGKPVESMATLKLPATFPAGYPIRFGVMEFTSSAELLLKEGTKLGRLVPNTQSRSLAIPTGASYLNVEIGRRDPQYYSVFSGKNAIGMGYPELQQAVSQGMVTHVIQCVISDANYKETSGEYYGVSVSETVYNLDLNVTVFDLTRKRTVLTGTYNAERTERRPFNRDHYEGDIFQVLLKIACQKAADGIVAAAAAQADGSAPKIQPAE